ncbi:MAG: D-2-hydroxyacid dehydrogenase family protein [Deltaproteobacteria bacterium]|nr:D-2-hydroxyacid dehydrogenase family protein [Deltaproteobacteria bacterium]
MSLVIVPDDFPSILSGTESLQRLRQFAEVIVYTEKASSPEELQQRLKGAGVAINIRAYSKFTEPLLRSCPQLKLIAVLGIGTDNVDLTAASRLGIKVSNTPGFSAVSVAEHTLALMMAAARKIPAHEQELRNGRWTRLPMTQLHGKTLGIVGLGNIGRQLASLARGIGMNIMAWTLNPSPDRAAEAGVQFVEFDQLLSQSDVIAITIRASEKTRNLISRQALARVKPSCILVNTARASIVDTAAMIEFLQTGKLAAAALDVYDQEPLPPADPLLSLANVVLSPHNAGMTAEAIEKGNQMVVDNVIAFLQGRLINLVNE